MANFKPGDRVRMTGQRCLPGLEFSQGREAIIISGLIGGYHDIDIIGYGPRFNGSQICALPEHLEPIQPEGYKVVSWDTCAWNPSMIGESA